jgi:hypothetical protein
MKYLYCLFILFISFSITSKINAQDNEKKLNFFGDVRFRAELDRDSDKTDGTTRDDRDRLRYRLRFGFKYTLNEYFEFGGRIRTGNSLNQQSPHVTIGKEFESDDFSIDKAYITGKTKHGIWVWAGKNSMPFWRQNGLLWNDDVNPEGISSGGKFNFSNNSSIEPIFGYFIAGHSGKNFSDDSSISIIQLKLNRNVGQNSLVLSSGIIYGSNIPDTPDDTSSFFINYNIWATSFQYNFKKLGLKLGLDYIENLKNYDNNENIANVYKDQTSAYIGSLTYTIKKFQFGLYYAHIEKFAVIDFFAQDDWVRWGNNNFTRSSNFSGQEIRIIYNINTQFNTVLRTYFVEGIKTTGSNLETGTRIRLDFNMKF